MSKIAEFVKQSLEMQSQAEHEENTKTAFTVRLDQFTVFCVGKLLLEVGGSRTALCQALIEEGVVDGLESIGYDLTSLQEEYFQVRIKEKKGVKNV